MECHHLLFRQHLRQGWVPHCKEMVRSRGRFRPYDLLWEVLDDVLDVLHHGNHHLSFRREIEDHTEVVVDLSLVGGHGHSILFA
jgi:hypothetical protein